MQCDFANIYLSATPMKTAYLKSKARTKSRGGLGEDEGKGNMPYEPALSQGSSRYVRAERGGKAVLNR